MIGKRKHRSPPKKRKVNNRLRYAMGGTISIYISHGACVREYNIQPRKPHEKMDQNRSKRLPHHLHELTGALRSRPRDVTTTSPGVDRRAADLAVLGRGSAGPAAVPARRRRRRPGRRWIERSVCHPRIPRQLILGILQPQIGHSIGLQAPISTRSVRARSRA